MTISTTQGRTPLQRLLAALFRVPELSAITKVTLPAQKELAELIPDPGSAVFELRLEGGDDEVDVTLMVSRGSVAARNLADRAWPDVQRRCLAWLDDGTALADGVHNVWLEFDACDPAGLRSEGVRRHALQSLAEAFRWSEAAAAMVEAWASLPPAAGYIFTPSHLKLKAGPAGELICKAYVEATSGACFAAIRPALEAISQIPAAPYFRTSSAMKPEIGPSEPMAPTSAKRSPT